MHSHELRRFRRGGLSVDLPYLDASVLKLAGYLVGSTLVTHQDSDGFGRDPGLAPDTDLLARHVEFLGESGSKDQTLASLDA
jgi:hypothetical protein